MTGVFALNLAEYHTASTARDRQAFLRGGAGGGIDAVNALLHDEVLAVPDVQVNDLGGTLMNESISRAAGADHGQELPPAAMEATARTEGRSVRQRTTLYAAPAALQRERSFLAPPLAPLVQTAPTKHRIADPLADAYRR